MSSDGFLKFANADKGVVLPKFEMNFLLDFFLVLCPLLFPEPELT